MPRDCVLMPALTHRRAKYRRIKRRAGVWPQQIGKYEIEAISGFDA